MTCGTCFTGVEGLPHARQPTDANAAVRIAQILQLVGFIACKPHLAGAPTPGLPHVLAVCCMLHEATAIAVPTPSETRCKGGYQGCAELPPWAAHARRDLHNTNVCLL